MDMVWFSMLPLNAGIYKQIQPTASNQSTSCETNLMQVYTVLSQTESIHIRWNPAKRHPSTADSHYNGQFQKSLASYCPSASVHFNTVNAEVNENVNLGYSQEQAYS